ncbi:MAG: lysophospholipid acyltransferase family protein [Deltaproteobacteria bacterium]
MSQVRAAGVLAGFLGLTLPLMPVQALLLRVSTPAARRFPNWYHRKVCRFLGVRIHVEGSVARSGPVLLVSNHTSWLDIPVLSAIAPLSFVAKAEVARWPFVSALARLQRTVFVDRTRRISVGDAAGEMALRLAEGDTLVLFAEGTSSDGNRVLPFRSALFAAAAPPGRPEAVNTPVVVQTVTLVYTRLHGVPLGRADRPIVGWYGDMEMQAHAWELLKAGPLDVVVRIGPPVSLSDYTGRKELAEKTEAAIREDLVRILRDRSPAEPIELAARSASRRLSLPKASSGDFR